MNILNNHYQKLFKKYPSKSINEVEIKPKDFWNAKDLREPPTNTYKATAADTDLVKLRNALQHSISHFKSEDFLIRETALLSRMIYRLKTKYRNSKDFQTLGKLKQSLNIYFRINFIRHLKHLLELTPTTYNRETYLPTKNMISFILVRIQGFAKLMERIYETCKIAAYQLNQKLLTGHFWKVLFLIYAVVARIFILAKYNTKVLCEIYGKILPHYHKLQNNGTNWLPKDYIFPTDLREWLGVAWVYEEDYVDLTIEPTTDVFDLLNLIDDGEDDVEVCDEYVLVNEEDEDVQFVNEFKKMKSIKEIVQSRNRMRGFSINEDDIGEEIDISTKDSSGNSVTNVNSAAYISNSKKSNKKRKKMKTAALRQENDVITIEDTEKSIAVDESYIVISDSPTKKLKPASSKSSSSALNFFIGNDQNFIPLETNLFQKENAHKDDSIIYVPDSPALNKNKGSTNFCDIKINGPQKRFKRKNNDSGRPSKKMRLENVQQNSKKKMKKKKQK